MLVDSLSQSTELTCIQLRNTSCRTQSLYNISHRMDIVIQYFKISTRNGHNTLILHILDAFCQDIIKAVTFMTYSFAEQIFQILYPDHNNITVL